MSDTIISITDIADAVKVLDYAAEQGAFRGWENIRQILSLRDRLDAFVAAATEADQQNQTAEEEQPSPATPDAPALSRRRGRISKEAN